MQSQFLNSEKQMKRRSVADALEVLRAEAGFGHADCAKISIAPISCGVASVALFFDGKIVLLPSAVRFYARRASSNARETFGIEMLRGGLVDKAGAVRLPDDTAFLAVEVIPARLPRKLSAFDWLVIYFAVEAVRATGQQIAFWRSLPDEIPPEFRETVPNKRLPHFAALAEITAPPFKVFDNYLAVNAPGFRVSRQKYEQLMSQVGMSTPVRRQRRADNGSRVK